MTADAMAAESGANSVDLMEAEPSEHVAEERRNVGSRFKPSLALAAFIMSLGTTAVTLFYALRGAEVVVLPPQQLLFYKDGEGAGSILTVLAKLDAINTTSSYGDVLLGSSIELTASGSRFSGTAIAVPTFRSDGGVASQEDCPTSSRCVRLAGLTVVEAAADVPDLPGGSGTSLPLVHALSQWNCEGALRRCEQFQNFDSAVAQLPKRFDLTVSIRLHGDGTRKFRCKVAPDLNYLKTVGWVSVPCS